MIAVVSKQTQKVTPSAKNGSPAMREVGASRGRTRNLTVHREVQDH